MALVPQCHPDRPHQARGLCKSCYLTVLGRENPALAKQCAEYNKRYRMTHLDYYWNWHLEYHHGITSEQYSRVLERQDGRCAICKRLPSPDRRLNVDHDHKTGTIRGLLCDKCNLLVGRIENNAELMPVLMAYLTLKRQP